MGSGKCTNGTDVRLNPAKAEGATGQSPPESIRARHILTRSEFASEPLFDPQYPKEGVDSTLNDARKTIANSKYLVYEFCWGISDTHL